jgi:PBP1b-binding outer membrane lipoprotein LpoB
MLQLQKKTILVVCLVSVVLLSGCSGFLPTDNGRSPETTPQAPTPEEPTRDTYPNGFSASSVNESVASDSHIDSLKEYGAFTVVERYRSTNNETQKASTNNWSINLNTETAVGELNGQLGNQQIYHTGNTAYLKRTAAETQNTTYQTVPYQWNSTQQTRGRLVKSLLSGVEIKYTGDKQNNGETFLYYNIVDTKNQLPQNASYHILDVTGHFLVSEQSGYISEVSMTTEYSNNRSIHNEMVITPKENLPLEEPSWVSNVED